jgi:hypothetical protein
MTGNLLASNFSCVIDAPRGVGEGVMRRLGKTFTALSAALLWPLTVAAQAPYDGSSFAAVWSEVKSDPYSQLPHYQVTLGSFFGFLVNHLYDASRRTLSDHSDLLPEFRKLVHPNGICFAGTWNITQPTLYTGAFLPGSRLIIARASTALTATERGQYRAFGFAGKIFPTNDPHRTVPTANFFTIEDLGGTLRDYYLDAENTNDIIHITLTPETFLNSPIGVAAATAFLRADQTLDLTQILVRQLYPLAEAGEPDPAQAKAPMWLKITGSADVPRIVANDFRDELRVANYPSGLRFDIWIADEGTRLGAKNWYKIGYIDVNDDALTDSCDHRLHFHHPPFRRSF